MMYESAKLREERASVGEELKGIVECAKAEERDLTDDEATKFDELEARHEKLGKDIERAEKAESIKPELRKDDAIEVSDPKGIEIKETATYTKDKHDRSYFRDLLTAKHGGREAQERLYQHAKEVRKEAENAGVELRALTSTDNAGGEFVAPLWLNQDFSALARSGRPLANAVRRLPLPPMTDSINIPTVSAGTTVGDQSDGGSVSNTDAVTSSVAASVRTIAGSQDFSRQLFDRSVPGIDQVILGDLAAAYASSLDTAILTNNNTGNKGIKNAGGNAITYNQTTPAFGGAGGLASNIASGISAVSTNRFLPPTAIVMHPRRWAWIMSQSDTTNRPLVVPGAAVNSVGLVDAVGAENVVGNIYGLPVIIDPNIATNVGAGTNQDTVYVLRLEDAWLFEEGSPTPLGPYFEVASANLNVRVQVMGYYAFTSERYPKAVSIISGTGLVTPAF